MILLRVGTKGSEQPAILDQTTSTIHDVRGLLGDAAADDFDYTSQSLAAGVIDITKAELKRTPLHTLPALGTLAEVEAGTLRIGTPITRPGKIVCVAKNYEDHAREMLGKGIGPDRAPGEPPPEPMLFMKATSALTGPRDEIIIPQGSTATDWEVELGVVIGLCANGPTRNVRTEDALEHVLGYTIINDITERHHQKNRNGQFTKGKSHDTFAPLGPYLVTTDEIKDPQALNLWTDLEQLPLPLKEAGGRGESEDVDAQALSPSGRGRGEGSGSPSHREGVGGRVPNVARTRMQDGSTRDMITPTAELISYISQFMTLEPGDVVATGTPAGVGAGRDPQVFLQAGQTLCAGISSADGVTLGEQVLKVVAAG